MEEARVDSIREGKKQDEIKDEAKYYSKRGKVSLAAGKKGQHMRPAFFFVKRTVLLYIAEH